MARSKRSGAIAHGWIPDQHGAWGMALTPLLVGLILAAADQVLGWIHLPLAVAWIAGFFAFSGLEKWVKTRRRSRLKVALGTYGVISAAATLISIVLQPQLLWWVLVFFPLMALSVALLWRRRERSLLARTSTIIAASTMTWVALSAGSAKPWFAAGVISIRQWLIGAILASYFLLTVPYVKTLIRERGSRPWLVGSVLAHTVAVAGLVALHSLNWEGLEVGWFSVSVWVALWLRSILMPSSAQLRGRPWRPAIVGVLETVLSIFVVVGLPW